MESVRIQFFQEYFENICSCFHGCYNFANRVYNPIFMHVILLIDYTLSSAFELHFFLLQIGIWFNSRRANDDVFDYLIIIIISDLMCCYLFRQILRMYELLLYMKFLHLILITIWNGNYAISTRYMPILTNNVYGFASTLIKC